MIELKGKKVADEIASNLLDRITKLKEKNFMPTLGIVRVGSNEDDIYYEKSAIKRMSTLGIETKVFEFADDIKQENFEKEFSEINKNNNIHGILLFLPLPKTLDEKKIKEMINPVKDVDCMCSHNLAKIFAGDRTGYVPCTALAVMEMLDSYDLDVSGKNVVVIGRSLVVGKPLSMLLLNNNATVTICHTKTENMQDICQRADIIVAAAGSSKMLTCEYVNSKSIVIDVGINVDENGKLCGDADYENIFNIVESISPVPRGVGTITTSVLAKQVVLATEYLSNSVDYIN